MILFLLDLVLGILELTVGFCKYDIPTGYTANLIIGFLLIFLSGIYLQQWIDGKDDDWDDEDRI